MDIHQNEISVERLLEQDIPHLVRFHKDIVMLNDFGNISLFSHPVRLKATTVLICLKGVIDCNINLHNYLVKENHMLINFATDMIHINKVKDFSGYAIILSEEFLRQIQLDFRFRTMSYITLRDNGPIAVPYEELTYLKPYYILMKKNVEEGIDEAVKGLAIALSHNIISLLQRYQVQKASESEHDEPRGRQLFDKFMKLLAAYHAKERSLQFYADKMNLSPKYVSGMIKTFSGRSPLDWINEYVVLEAEMMLRYTDMTVQEIAYSLNFPTQSAFGKYFKQRSGVSPKRYRAEI